MLREPLFKYTLHEYLEFRQKLWASKNGLFVPFMSRNVPLEYC